MNSPESWLIFGKCLKIFRDFSLNFQPYPVLLGLRGVRICKQEVSTHYFQTNNDA